MKPGTMARNRGQVYSVGNYLMTGKVLGKGHFARVEEATHRVIGKKVAIKIIDLTLIKEEYARRNLHREPRVMARLRHPCIAALYETMMHGPRLYVVMEAACGGDLCTHVLSARGIARGLPETRARALAAQLVSAVRHMHMRGVVHRDLKMENIMLDSTKQFIKIVDFGLSNLWTAGATLKTPCGSLEYAAPELFVDGRKYGPEVDLWSIGVIVFGMVTGGLPFTDGGEGPSRPKLRAAISKGFTRQQRAALACVSTECKTFIQHLLEPTVELRMRIEEAARHRWLRRPGQRMRCHPLPPLDSKNNKDVYKAISDLLGQSVMDVVAGIKADPFGAIAGMYNIKTHLQQLQAISGVDTLWSNVAQETRPPSPPEYKEKFLERPDSASSSKWIIPQNTTANPIKRTDSSCSPASLAYAPKQPSCTKNAATNGTSSTVIKRDLKSTLKPVTTVAEVKRILPSPRFLLFNRPVGSIYGKKPACKSGNENGDGLEARLPCIDEISNTDLNEARRGVRGVRGKLPVTKKVNLEDTTLRLNSCPLRTNDKRMEFYRRGGDGLPSWRATGSLHTPPARILLQSHATTIKRASLGNIVSPHSSTNSQCKSERSKPVGWYSSTLGKDSPHLQRMRRSTPLK